MGLLTRAWCSPTGATWLAHLSRSLGVVLLLPLALSRLSPGDAVVWLLFETIVGMAFLADFGLAPTFIRAIAYGAGGADRKALAGGSRVRSSKAGANWETLWAVVATMKVVYRRLALAAAVLLLTLGTAAIVGPLEATSDHQRAALAWVVVLVACPLTLWAESYGAYLQGMNLVPLYRRWQALSYLGSAATGILVLLAGGQLLGLTVATHAWVIGWIAIRAWLCDQVLDGRFRDVPTRHEPDVMAAIWPSAWRSGLGLWFGHGTLQASAILYAQVAPTTAAGAYLLGLRLLNFISGFSRAPFYSRLPELATLFARGEKTRLVALACQAMRWSHWSYVVLFLGAGVTLAPALEWIGSQTPAPSSALWGGLGLALLAERYGAMHIQLYSLTNHIVWHVANGVAGTLFVVVSLMLIEPLGVYAFPLGLLAANVSFYAPYSAHHSHREFDLTIRGFDLAAGGRAIVLAVLVVAATIAASGPASL